MMDEWIKRELSKIGDVNEDFASDKAAFDDSKDSMVRTLEASMSKNDEFNDLLVKLSYKELDTIAELINTTMWIAYATARIELRDGTSKL